MRPLLALVTCLGIAACGGGSSSDSPDAGPTFDATPPQPDAQTLNCASLTKSPKVTLLPGFVGTEDIAFDSAGNVIESDETNIYKTTRSGNRTTFVPNLEFRAGMRMASSGNLFVNDDKQGRVLRVAAVGGSPLAIKTGLSYPNGMEIGADGFVYISDQSDNKVYRINPDTGASTVLTDAVPMPNGLTFNKDYTKLYIGSFGGTGDAAIYQLEIGAGGTPGALSKYKTGVGTGSHDGMAVDACDNLYVADYGNSKVYRITPAGEVTAVVEADGAAFQYHANFDWGRGAGGWSTDKLYVLTVGDGIKEVELGVPSKPRK